MPALQLTDAEVIRVAMRLLGQRTSAKKARASRANGKLAWSKKRKAKSVPQSGNAAK